MKRTKPGRKRINEALFTLLENKTLNDINVVNLCTKANVSRSTFYAHYSNIDDVYRELVRELVLTTSAIRPQLRCSDCIDGSAKQPLCELIRKGGKYYVLTGEDRFIQTFFDISKAEFKDETTSIYDSVCTDKNLAYALFCFQMMGCIGTARMIPATTDWSQVRQILDTFIRGGLSSVRGLNMTLEHGGFK